MYSPVAIFYTRKVSFKAINPNETILENALRYLKKHPEEKHKEFSFEEEELDSLEIRETGEQYWAFLGICKNTKNGRSWRVLRVFKCQSGGQDLHLLMGLDGIGEPGNVIDYEHFRMASKTFVKAKLG